MCDAVVQHIGYRVVRQDVSVPESHAEQVMSPKWLQKSGTVCFVYRGWR